MSNTAYMTTGSSKPDPQLLAIAMLPMLGCVGMRSPEELAAML